MTADRVRTVRGPDSARLWVLEDVADWLGVPKYRLSRTVREWGGSIQHIKIGKWPRVYKIGALDADSVVIAARIYGAGSIDEARKLVAM